MIFQRIHWNRILIQLLILFLIPDSRHILQSAEKSSLYEAVFTTTANHPKQIQAIILYGPIQLHWRTDRELNNKSFSVERKLENSKWEKIGEVTASGISVFPRNYFYEDVSTFESGVVLYYQIIQTSQSGHQWTSSPLKIIYNPEMNRSGFSSVRLDTVQNVVNLTFQTKMSGHVQIDLYYDGSRQKKCLTQKTLCAGCYSLLIDLQPQKTDPSFCTGFCRLEAIALKGKNSFIQIKPIETNNLID